MRHPVAEIRPAKSPPTPQGLRSELLHAREQSQESGWNLARAIAAFVKAEAWQHFAFGEHEERTREAWIREDLHGYYTPSAVSRLVSVVRQVEKLPLRERGQFYSAPVWNVVEALSAESVTEAAALVSSGKTQQEIRGTVKSRKERKALANGESPTPKPESWVSIEIQLPAELAKRWEGVLNLVRFRLHRPTPAVPTILEALIVDCEQNWERDTDPKSLTHRTSDGVELAWTREQVAAGELRCRMCGSWDTQRLQPHHIVPRSREKKCCGVEHEQPIALLCAQPCHSSIKDSAEGSWAVWAARWGYGELATEHGGRFDPNELVPASVSRG